MNILSAENISKSYSEKILFKDISIGIGDGDKIGLIGINGTGKSTLLKVLAGVEISDSGSIIKGSSLKIEYLSQNPHFEKGATVLEQVFKGNSPVMKLIREYESALGAVNDNPGNEQLEKKLLALSGKMDAEGAWTIESEAKSVLTRLGISDFNAIVDTLSGGQRKRIAMAGALISPSDLLILDEPTNHIDNDTVDWLENYLNNRKGALLMVTHDRYFLDRVANRILELDNGKIYNYQANYSKFLEMKAEREELEQASEKKRQSLLKSELEWIRRGARARTTKQKARIERFEKLKQEQGIADNGNVEIKVGSARLGKKIIEIDNISKSYSNVNLIKDLSYILLRDDRIGIIGQNGIGKSTLLRIISGAIEPDEGSVVRGETVKIGFFTQESEEMDSSLRVIDYIKEEAEFIKTKDGSLSASQMLERFLFSPELQWTPIAKLSGGEKRRLYLLRVLMEAPNILLLDEPTNDLDIQTLTILESYLDEFPGVVIVVSHDRYFLDRVTNKTFSFEGDGVVKQFNGNYSFYKECKEKDEDEASNKKNEIVEKKNKNSNQSKDDRPLKFTYKEQREFDTIDEVIEGLETKIEELNKSINEAASDYGRLQELLTEREKVEVELNNAIDRWTFLNELAEKIEQNKNNN